MAIPIQSVSSSSFCPYGRIVEGYDFSGLLKNLREKTPCPADRTVYFPSAPVLEEDAVYGALQNRFYGGMPVQIGCCNGYNTFLNCLEYHRDSEVNIAADDVILLVARRQDIADGMLDTARVEAFLLPAGTAVELYAETLHYAPCAARAGEGFRVAVVLPRGTNLAKPDICPGNAEDEMLRAANKWLLAHPDSPEAAQGAHVGLCGENLNLEGQI